MVLNGIKFEIKISQKTIQTLNICVLWNKIHTAERGVYMSRRMEVTIRITDEEGNEVIKASSQRDLPFLEEFDTQGFRKSFDQIERSILDARKEVCEKAVSKYLAEVSKKN